MARVFRFMIFAMIAALSGAGVTLLLHFMGVAKSSGAADFSYTDFISITLTALGLMITILGFFVAAAGVIGWTTLENKLKDHSVSYFKEQLSKNGELREEIEQLIVEIAHEGINQSKDNIGIQGKKIAQAEDEEYND